MDILHLEEIPAKHIVKRWTKDARDILSEHLVHLVQYQKDTSVNLSFTCRHSTLYFKAMDGVRMGDASAQSFKFMFAGPEALLVNGAPLAEKRDGLGFEDRMGGLPKGKLPSNGEVAYVGGNGADHCQSVGHSGSVNALQGLAAADNQRGRKANE